MFQRSKQGHVFVMLMCLLCLMSLTLAACDAFGSQPSQTTASNCPSFSSAPLRPVRIIALGLDINAVYNRTYALAAKNAVASAFDAAIQPGQGAITLYVSLITHDSFNAAATVMVLTAPSTPALPQAPVWSSDPYKKAVQQQCFKSAMTQVQNRLHSIRKQVKVQTDKLRAYSLPAADPGENDSDGFLTRAASRFQAGGSHTLLVVSGFRDQEDNEFDGDIPGLDLTGATVRVLWYDAGSKDDTLRYTPAWRSVFSHAGATTITFLDPSESQTLSSFF